MTLPVFPEDFPAPVQDGYQIGSVDPLARTEMEDGAPYSRRKNLTLWTPIPIKMIITHEQAEELYNFWHATLNGGASRFTMPIHTLRSSEDPVQNVVAMWEGGSPVFQRYQDSDEILATFQVKVRFS